LAQEVEVVPFKDPEKKKSKQKEYARRWYEKNRKKHIATAGKNRDKARDAWLLYKGSLSCAHCGVKHPAVIDFHHTVKDETYQSVFALAANGRYAAARKEASKCVALCANCHRVLHYEVHQERRRVRRKRRKKKKKSTRQP
jgi:hypothetical protein